MPGIEKARRRWWEDGGKRDFVSRAARAMVDSSIDRFRIFFLGMLVERDLL